MRTDHGGENGDVWTDVIQAWGDEARSVTVGSSVHNQRVERQNHAANEQVLSVFRDEFYHLEWEGLLDPLNDTDLFCLHYVYMPRVNKSVSEFITAQQSCRLNRKQQHPSSNMLAQPTSHYLS